MNDPNLILSGVFTSRQDGYHSHRISAIETAPDELLISLADARKSRRADPFDLAYLEQPK